MKDVNINKDYYGSLFLKINCKEKSIKKSYRALVFKYHPDKNSDETANIKFDEITEAYDVLSNKDKKMFYDKNSLYGNQYDYNNHKVHVKSTTSKYDKEYQERKKYYIKTDINRLVTLSFKEYYEGKPFNVSYYRQMLCDDCLGYGNDSSGGIECAMCDGTGLSPYMLKGNGKCTMCGGNRYISTSGCKPCKGKGLYEKKQIIKLDKLYRFTPGETYTQEYSKGGNYNRVNDGYGKFLLNIKVETDKDYKIDKDYTLHRKINIHYEDAIKGNKIEYHHIDGKTYKINLSINTKDGDTLKLTKKGLKEGRFRKDLHLHVNIIIDYNRI